MCPIYARQIYEVNCQFERRKATIVEMNCLSEQTTSAMAMAMTMAMANVRIAKSE